MTEETVPGSLQPGEVRFARVAILIDRPGYSDPFDPALSVEGSETL
jgi:hypothetical protein